MRPFLLLVRGARRGCFHPRSFAVLTDSLPRRAFSPRARLSAAAVWRLLLRGQHGYALLYAICRGLSSRRVYFLYPYAVKGLLLGLTMSRPLSPPAVLPHAPSLPARRSGRPCPPNTAQRCHSEPVRRLAWESVPLASLGEGGVTAFGRDGGREKTETGGVPQGHSFRFAPQRRAPPLRSVEAPQRPTGGKAPPPSAACYFSSRRGAALKAYFVYVEAPQRPTGEKAPPPSAARYFSSRRGAALKAYFVYVEVLQRCIGGKEPPPTRPRRRTPAYTPPPPRSAPARTHP